MSKMGRVSRILMCFIIIQDLLVSVHRWVGRDIQVFVCLYVWILCMNCMHVQYIIYIRLQTCIGHAILLSFVNFQSKHRNYKVLLQSILCKLSVCQMDQFNLMVFPKEQFDFKTIADNYELLYTNITHFHRAFVVDLFLCLMKLDMST